MLNNDGYFNLFTIGKEVLKQKFVFCGVFLICVIGAYLFSVLSAPQYEAQITLMPVAQSGEDASISGLSAVSSLLGNNSPGSAEIPSWYEATIIMKTRDFAKNFIVSQNIVETLIEEHGLDLDWAQLSETQKIAQLNRLARIWVNNNIELEQDPVSNIYYFSVFSADADRAVMWANQYVQDINAHLKAHLIEENEHKIAFYRERIEQERIADIKISIIGLLSSVVQKNALIDTREEIVLRTIDRAEAAILSFPIMTLNLAIGIFVGLLLAFVTILVIGAYRQYRLTEEDA